MRQRFASSLSFWFGPPVLMPIFSLLTFCWAGVDFGQPKTIGLVLIVLFLEWMVPVWFFVRQLKQGSISSLEAPIRQERVAVYSLTLITWTLSLFILKVFAPPLLFRWHSVLYPIILSLAIITYFYKVSVHAGLNFGFYLLLTLVYPGTFLWALPVPFLVAWSRYRIKNHSLTELALGAVVGLLSVYWGYYWLL